MATRFRHAALVGKFNAEGIREELEDVAAFLVAKGLAVTLEEDTAAQDRDRPLSASSGGCARRARATSPSSSAATARCSASPASSPATTRRWSASTRAGSASSPTSALDDFETALAPILAGEYDEEQRTMLEGEVERDGKTIFDERRAQRRHRQPRRHRRHGRAAHRDRRRVRRPPARRRPHRRLADRIDRLCAVGGRPDPAPGGRRLGAGADRAARPLEPADRRPRQRRGRRSRSSPAATRA